MGADWHVANPVRRIPKAAQVRADTLMQAYIHGRLQVGLDWPEAEAYRAVYGLALRRAMWELGLVESP